jgi:hypothetical protein
MGISEILELWKNGETVFHAGQELKNASAWKSNAVVMNLLGALVAIATAAATYLGVNFQLDLASIDNLSTVIVSIHNVVVSDEFKSAAGTLVFVYNSFVHVATSSKIGLQAPKNNQA